MCTPFFARLDRPNMDLGDITNPQQAQSSLGHYLLLCNYILKSRCGLVKNDTLCLSPFSVAVIRPESG